MSTEPVGPLTREIVGIVRGRAARFGLTQSQLAEFVDVTQSQLSKILRGTKSLTLDQLEGLCHALDLDIEQVVNEAEEISRDDLWDRLPEPFVLDDRPNIPRRTDRVRAGMQDATRDALPTIPKGVAVRREGDAALAADRGEDQGDESRDSGGATR